MSSRAKIAGGLAGAGLLAGVVFAATSANAIAGAPTIASPSATAAAGAEDIVVSSGAPAPGSSGTSGSSGSEDSTTGSAGAGTDDPAGPGRGGMQSLDKSGTVKAVGTASVTIKTATSATTYSVTTDSDIDKNGEAKLSDLKVGDAVRFSTTGTNVIDKLHAGTESLNMPGGRHGGGHGSGGRDGGAGDTARSTGTITAISGSSITIKTSTATTKYTVDANSDIDLATGEGTLAKLKVGDKVTFNVTGTTVIDHLRVN